MIKLARAIYVDLNYTFNSTYIICRFEHYKYIEFMCDFKRNVALSYVMQKIPVK